MAEKEKLESLARYVLALDEPWITSLGKEEEQEYSTPVDDDDDKSAVHQIQEKAKEELNKLRIENEALKQLSLHRIQYSWYIFWFVIGFVVISLGLVLLSGNGIICLSDTVLGVLLGTNMVQVIGVLYIVANWLYPTNNQK